MNRPREACPRLGTRLYAIADAATLGTDPWRFAECVAAMVLGGVRILQLRLKPARSSAGSGDDRWRFEVIEQTQRRLPEHSGELQLWLDDRADLAACFRRAFYGVHVGQHDLAPAAVRRVLSAAAGGAEGRRIGLSCHDLEQVRRANQDEAVDWVAIGPVFRTGSKIDADPVVGLAGVGAARAVTSKPLVAIGGIDEQTMARVLAAGADAAVVLSALVAGGREPSAIERTVRRLLARTEGRADEPLRLGIQSTDGEYKPG